MMKICVWLMVAASVSLLVSGAEAAVLFQENWESGTINPLKWHLDGGGGPTGGPFLYNLQTLGMTPTSDWALFLQGSNYDQGVRSLLSFDRQDYMACTFKMMAQDDPPMDYIGPAGPWTGRVALQGSHPVLTQIEAGVSRYNQTTGHTYYMEGMRDTYTGDDGAALSTAFTTAFENARTKANAVTVRVTLGPTTGAKMEWSADGVNFTTEFDTIGMTAGQVYAGDNKVSSISPAYVYFGGSGSATQRCIIDDIMVEQLALQPVEIQATDGSTAVNEAGPTTDTYTVALASVPLDNVLVTVTPDSQVELNGAGAATAVELTFATASGTAPQTITVMAIDDLAGEGAHTGVITHRSSSTDEDFNDVVIPDVIVQITDNDSSGVPWLTLEDVTPTGEYYQAVVPDTLDLAERARIAIHGLTQFLDPNLEYATYGHGVYLTNPAHMYHDHTAGYSQNWGKIAEAIVRMRHMCGSLDHRDIQVATFKGMIGYAECLSRWETYPVPLARIILALTALYEQSPDPELVDLIALYSQDLHERATEAVDYARYGTDDPDPNPLLGYYLQAFTNGTCARALCKWVDEGGDANHLTFTEKLKNFLIDTQINPRAELYWTPEAAPKVIVGREHGQLSGHMHGYLQGLMGLVYHAELTNNARLKQFVRDSYEYLRNFGIARIGLFGEGCGSGDMTYLAIKLSDWAVGDYWEDVDQYVRNHLTELQYRDPNTMQTLVDQMPAFDPGSVTVPYTTDDVIGRCVGMFFSDAWTPTWIPADPGFIRLQWVVCCTGNCTKGLYEAWNGIVRYQQGAAWVNLLLNRASPWLDLDSYLPYEGKVVIRNKAAERLFVRIPRWVDKQAVTCGVNGQATGFDWVSQYMRLTGLRAGDVVVIEFPMVQTVEQYSLWWSPGQSLWKETTDPGSVPANADVYTCTFRGNTLVNISSSHPTPTRYYPLYADRGGYLSGVAPFTTVTRFVAEGGLAPDTCTDKPRGDLNGDCRVTLEDFTLFSSDWLDCGSFNQAECGR